jgi:hypothetical protein
MGRPRAALHQGHAEGAPVWIMGKHLRCNRHWPSQLDGGALTMFAVAQLQHHYMLQVY